MWRHPEENLIKSFDVFYTLLTTHKSLISEQLGI